MKNNIAAMALGALVFAAAAAGAEVEIVTPKQAFERLQAPGTFLVDVRSVAEYVFVGHPEMGWNVPWSFWSESEAKLVSNPDFIKDLKARFKPEDILLFICRSGGRSLKAAQLAAADGFLKTISVSEGVEGGADEKGLRTIGGWKNSGLPFTYSLDPQKAYAPAK
ncbi:MAG: rhodanese-like domain-containing protein [Candidatus Aminicenantes bacterium]|nr:rhodanese-like domain-containing protein [Candidatus Aminicenantes bacterium]